MTKIKNVCKYCGIEYEDCDITTSIFNNEILVCEKCKSINELNAFVSNYDKEHKSKVWANKVHERNMIKDDIDYGDGVSSYTLAKHKSSYRVEKRTNRVQNVIDKISYIRDYLYMNLQPIFEILDSIYIKKDQFWNETGNLIRYVHNCCFQEVVLKLRELLMDGSCKYSVKKISNTLLADSKYVFKEQEIYERLEFDVSRDVMEERYEPFEIDKFVSLINEVLNDNKSILAAMKDYRDNYFAHIDTLKNEASIKEMSYVNVKRMFSLIKTIYDGFLFVVAPDKYASIMLNSNIRFSHLNEISKIYHKYQEDEKRRIKEEIKKVIKKD